MEYRLDNKIKGKQGIVARVLMVLMVAMLLVGNVNPTKAYAATAAEKKAAVESLIISTCVITDSGSIKYNNGTVRAYVKEKADSTYTQAVTLSDGQTIVFYNGASLEVLYKQAVKIAENEKVGDKLNDISDNMGVQANTGAAATMLSGFQPIVELVVGGIVILISFGMTLFSAFDIAYIAFPVFRNKCTEATQSGGNSMLAKKTSGGDSKLRFVSDEAQYAIQAGTLESGKSPWSIYFGKRMASYVFLGIIQFILLTGNITIITSIAVKLVSGVLDVLTGLAS